MRFSSDQTCAHRGGREDVAEDRGIDQRRAHGCALSIASGWLGARYFLPTASRIIVIVSFFTREAISSCTGDIALTHVCLFRRRRHVDLALARRLDAGDRRLLVLHRILVVQRRRVLHRAFEGRPDVGGQLLPERLVHDDHVVADRVIGERHVLLHLVLLLRVQVGERSFGAVDDACLQRLVDLGKRHRLRHGADRFHDRRVDLRRIDPHLETLHLARRVDRPVRAHDAEAVVPERESDHPLRLELLQERRAGRPVIDALQRLQVRKHVRQIEHLEFRQPRRPELARHRRQHLHRAELQRVQFLGVLEELAVRIDLDFHAALGPLLGEPLEFERGLSLRRVGRGDVAELDDDRLLRRGSAGRKQPERGGDACDEQFHDSLLRVDAGMPGRFFRALHPLSSIPRPIPARAGAARRGSGRARQSDRRRARTCRTAA